VLQTPVEAGADAAVLSRQAAVNELARRALSHFDNAQEHLRTGDWTNYGTSLQQLENVLQRLSEEAAQLE